MTASWRPWAVLVCAGLFLGACTSQPEEQGEPSETSTVEPEVPGRDPVVWPYPSDSIWNYPRGDASNLIPFTPAVGEQVITAEEDILIIAPESTGVDVQLTTAGWDPAQTRCGSITDEVLLTDIPVPTGWVTDPDYTGTTPNHSAAILTEDLTLIETQPFHVCEDGRVVSQFAPEPWRGDSIVTGGVAPDVGAGAHGGSGLTAFGGTVRLGEWVPGGRIPHSVKVTVDAAELSQNEGGFRWPASRADSYYGTSYLGTIDAARMGALLTVAPDFPVEDLDTEPARILARAIRDYGAYIVDDAAQPTIGLAVEWGPQGRVRDEFAARWGFDFAERPVDVDSEHARFWQDLNAIYASMMVVDDNDASSIGGAGERLAPLAPPLEVP